MRYNEIKKGDVLEIKAIIFDMDGVLIDGEGIFADCCTEVLNKHGIPCSTDDFMPFRGMGEKAYLGGVMNKYGFEYIDDIKHETYNYYAQILPHKLNDNGDSRRVVLSYRGKCKLAVASGADRFKVETNINALGLSVNDFDVVTGGDEVQKNKPDPEIFIKSAEKCSVKCSECIVIEDSLSGIKSAKAAGMKVIGLTGTCEKNELVQSGAEWVVDKLTGLWDIII